jgi:hypothetical protein
MSTLRRLFTIALTLLMLAPASAFAGSQHATDAAGLAAAVAAHASAQDADRAAVREALARPEVQRVARRAGVDLGRLSAAVDTMAPSDLAHAADAARRVNDELVGGANSITISTTTIIIALLVVILIVVAAR